MGEDIQDMKFDDALQRLESLVNQLESGRLSLEDSMKAFEEGTKLHKICADKLGEAQKKIELLVKNSAGEWTWSEQKTEKTEQVPE